MIPVDPKRLEATYRQGLALRRQGQTNRAQAAFEAVVRAMPKHGPTHYQLALIAQDKRIDWAAEKHGSAAVKLMPKEPAVWLTYASILAEMSKYDAAMKALKKAERLNPPKETVWWKYAYFYQQMGDFAAAEGYLKKCLKLKPRNGSLYRMLSIAHKFTPDDPLIHKMQEVRALDGLGANDKWSLDFALSKAMEDTKDYSKAFEYLKRANDLVAQTHPYDRQERLDEVAGLKAAQRNVDYGKVTSTSDAAPVFVTGMPRSGTTLIEQIIAAHPQMTAVGETGFGSRRARALLAKKGGFHPLETVRDKLQSLVGETYVRDIAYRYPDAGRVVDKTIQSYMYIGALHLAMPKARFVIVTRDPRDNLLSIYRNVFSEGAHRYAYDFETLADHYKTFLDMIAFWRETLPDVIYEASYDALVADPEPQSRALIQASGLEWDDACLDFHKSKEAVKTLSLAQVRQPIYKSSQKAWQRYGDAISPLLDALDKRGIDVSEWD